MAAAGVLEEARVAFAARRWREAREGFAAARDVTLDDLDMYALSAYLIGHEEECLDI